jgi:predicted site-specific integrase-resolvase
MTPTLSREWLKKSEVADVFGVTVRTVTNWIGEGKFENGVRKVSSHTLRISAASVERLLQQK